MMVENDCEDQGMRPTEFCTQCRIGFHGDRPVYAKLALRGRFWCCVNCGSSYGENPHQNCPPVSDTTSQIEPLCEALKPFAASPRRRSSLLMQPCAMTVLRSCQRKTFDCQISSARKRYLVRTETLFGNERAPQREE